MTPFSRNTISAIILVAGGIATPIVAWWLKGTEYQNMWIYVLTASFVLYAAYELYSGLTNGE